MNLSSIASVVVAVLGATQCAGAASFDFSVQADVFFSRSDSRDHLSATLKGTSCDDAVFTFAIYHEGTEMFQRVIPMAQVLPCEWVLREPEHAHWAALHVLNGAVSVVRAVDRGCHEPSQVGCWVGPGFERLQKANKPLVCFHTGSESSTCVAYDSDTKAVIEVRSYSE